MFTKTLLVLSAILILAAPPGVRGGHRHAGSAGIDARQAQIADIQRDLSRDDVRQAMIAMGVQPNRQLRVFRSATANSPAALELASLPAAATAFWPRSGGVRRC
jgi:Fe2+ transport system protein FeoA